MVPGPALPGGDGSLAFLFPQRPERGGKHLGPLRSFQESPSAMPITRDLSEGKRLTLLLWCWLVQNKYPATSIDLGVLESDSAS